VATIYIHKQEDMMVMILLTSASVCHRLSWGPYSTAQWVMGETRTRDLSITSLTFHR